MAKVFDIAFKLGAELTSSFKSAFGEADSTMSKLSAAATALGGGALLTGAVTQVIEMSDSLAKLSAQTGTYGADMTELGDVAKNVFKAGHGESFDDVTAALANVKQNFQNLDSGELEKITGNAMMFADTFDSDVTEVTRTASVMMKTFGDDSEKTMDLMAHAFQKGGNFSDELLDTMREYSPQFKALGYDSEAFTSVLIAGAEAGAFNLDKIGDAAKESFLKVGDGSTGSREALAALGMDFQQIEADINSGGESANSAFAAVASAIALVQDPAEKSRLAVALMGTPIEDLGPEFQDFFANVSTELVGFEGAMQKINDVRFDTVGAAIRGIGRILLVDLVVPIGEAVLPYLNDLATFLRDNLPAAIEKTKSIFQTVAPILLGLVAAFATYRTILFATMAAQAVYNAVLAASTLLYTAHRGAMIAYALAGGGVRGMLAALAAAQTVLNVTMLANPIVAVTAALVGLGVAFYAAYKMSDSFREAVNNAFSSVVNFVDSAASYVASQAHRIWSGLLAGAGSIGSIISGAVSGIGYFIVNVIGKEIAENASVLWSGLSSGVGSIGAILSNSVKGIGTIIANAIGSELAGKAGVAINGFIESIKNGFSSLPGIISMIAPTITALGLGFLGVSAPITAVIAGIVSLVGFLYRLAQTNSTVANAFSSAWQSIQSAFAPVLAVLSEGIAQFSAEVGPQFQETLVIMSESIAALGPSFAELGATLGELAAMAIQLWSQVGTSVLTLATTIFPMLLQTAQTVIPLIASIFIAVFPIIIQLVASLLPIILQIAQMALPLLMSAVQMIFPLIVSILTAVLPIIIQLIGSLAPIILQIAQMILPILLMAVQMIFPMILAIIQMVLPIFVQLLTMVVGIVLQLAQAALPILMSIVQMVFPIIMSIIQMAIPVIIAVLQTLVAIINGVIIPAINGILAVVQIVFPLVTTIIQTALTIINGIITAAMALLQGDWNGAWNAILSTATTIMNNIISFFSGIDLYSVGVAIINGLINGIKSMAGAIGSAISSLIPAPLKSAVSGVIGAIPGFAKGGVVSSPTLAWIGEGGDTETIIPHNNAARSKALWVGAGHALGMFDAMKNQGQDTDFGSSAYSVKMSDARPSSSGGGGQTVVEYKPVYNINGGNIDEIQRMLDQRDRELMDKLEQMQRDGKRVSFS